jgi:hypothetical protein
MKVCISNNINLDSHILGDSFDTFDKVMKWLSLCLQRPARYEDIILKTDQVAAWNEIVRNDAVAILNKYTNNAGMAVQLLDVEIKIPPTKHAFSEISFINRIYKTNVKIIKNRGCLFFDFYEYDSLIETGYRSFGSDASLYTKTDIYANFARIYLKHQKDKNLAADFNKSIKKLIDNRIIDMENDTYRLTEKGKRIFAVLKGPATVPRT